MTKTKIKITPKVAVIYLSVTIILIAFLYWLFAYVLKTEQELMSECDIFGRNKYTGYPCEAQYESRQEKRTDPCTVNFYDFRNNPRAIYNIANLLEHNDLVYFDSNGHLVATDTHQNILREIARRCGRGNENFYQTRGDAEQQTPNSRDESQQTPNSRDEGQQTPNSRDNSNIFS